MEIVLGADTLCWHGRLVADEISIDDVVKESADLGATFVQMNLYHLRGMSLQAQRDLRGLAAGVGVELQAAGDFIGSPRRGDTVASAVARIDEWARQAEAIGSDIVRVASGFYRHEMMERQDLIDAEREFVTASLREGGKVAAERGVKVLMENHSDFTVEEVSRIMADVADPNVGIFLDIINPVTMLSDPVAVVERLAPFAPAGHAKDYRFESMHVPGKFHRRGFKVNYCYPGEGVAPLRRLIDALKANARVDRYYLSVEGLDNRRGVADQAERLGKSFEVLRGLF